jgi:hypothetical protein
MQSSADTTWRLGFFDTRHTEECFVVTSLPSALENISDNLSTLSALPHRNASDFMPMLGGSIEGSLFAFACHSMCSLDCDNCCRGIVPWYLGPDEGLVGEENMN